MPGVQLLGFSVSPYVRSARIALAEKGLEYEFKEISFEDLTTPEYAKLNPFRRMPSLVTPEVVLYETPAILRYIDEAFDGLRLQPETARERAEMTRWMSVAQSYLYPVGIGQIFVQRVMVPASGGTADEALLAAAARTIHDHLGVIEQQLGSGAYLAGASMSLADILTAAMIELISRTPEGAAALAAHPRLGSWFKALRQRPSFESTLPAMFRS